MIVRAHHDVLEEIGSVKLNTAPRGVLLVAQTRPWCASTIQREIASPMPMPVSLVVKNGSNTRSTSSSPLPVSRVSINTVLVPLRVERNDMHLGSLCSHVTGVRSVT